MKKIIIGLITVMLLTSVELSHDIIIMSRDQFESQVEVMSSQDFVAITKKTVHGGYLYVLEKDRGIHVINLLDPANPLKEKYIQIPGIQSMDFNGNKMYARAVVDLVVFDLNTFEELNRVRNMFPSRFSNLQYSLPEGSIVLKYEEI